MLSTLQTETQEFESWKVLIESDEFCLRQVKAASVVELEELEEFKVSPSLTKLEEHARTQQETFATVEQALT